VPRRTNLRARAGAARGPAIVGGAGLAIIANPSAGSRGADTIVDDLAADLPDALVISIGDGPLEAAFSRAAGASVLGVVGGDGTINAAAEHALASSRPLAVFPGGTLNHFARDLGVDDEGATVGALRNGDLVAVDAGTIDAAPFLNTASFGSYAEFVDCRERFEGAIGKWAAAVVAAAYVLARASAVRVEIDGEERRIWMIFIGNCAYDPPNLAPRSRPRLDDGFFDVRFVDGSGRWSRARLLGALATGRLARSKVYTRMLVRSLEIHSLDGPLRLARDGETFDGGTDVRVAKHPERLRVYAPRSVSS
jgi:diacylglycerol kinase family enzyme